MTQALAGFEPASQIVLGWLVRMNFWTAMILLLVVAADQLLAARVGARFRSLLYLAIPLRFCIPFEWTRGLSLAPEVSGRVSPLPEGGISAMNLSEILVSAPVAVATPAPLPWATMLLSLHVLVGIVLVARWARSHHLISQLAAEARPLDSLPSASGDIPILAHPSWGPGVVGILRPRIIVPEAEAERGSLGWILRHEAAHLERRDHWTLPLTQLFVLLLWPVVPLWFALLRYRRLVEMACDERAVRGETVHSRRSYGELLLSFAGAEVQPQWMEVSMRHDVASRIRELTRRSRWRLPIQLACTAGLAIGLTLAIGPGAIGMPPEADPGPPATVPAAAPPDSCEESIALVVDQFRYARLVDSRPTPDGVRFEIELTAPEPVLSSTMLSLKRFLDDRGLTTVSLRGLQPRQPAQGPAVHPYEFEVTCGEPETFDSAAAQAEIGFQCPEGGSTDGLAETLAQLSAEKIPEARLTERGERLEIEGTATDIPSVTNLVASLEGCPSFEEVDLSEVRQIADGFTFRMSAAPASSL